MNPVAAIRFAMMAGVLLFGGVTWFVQRGPEWTPTEAESLISVARFFWLAVVAGLVFLIPRYRAAESPARAHTIAIIAWSLGETLALYGGVIYYLAGIPGWYVAGVLALAATFVACPGRAIG